MARSDFPSAKSSVTLLAIGSESRQPVTLDYMARYMLSDLSFDDYLRAGGWRGYAQRAAKDAFVSEARSWLEPLQQMLDAEEARLRALECTTADDFLVVDRDQTPVGHTYTLPENFHGRRPTLSDHAG
jgi:hypothetical protein